MHGNNESCIFIFIDKLGISIVMKVRRMWLWFNISISIIRDLYMNNTISYHIHTYHN